MTDLSTLSRGLTVQTRSMGAIMMRELHTRFGRQNIGYLWLILEPMILSGGVSITHIFVLGHNRPHGIEPAAFYASGYITYIAMRNNVNRSTGMIESNKPLLYHKSVTLQDISWARTALEGLAVLGAMITILGSYILLGLSSVPERPGLILLGLVLMTWLSGGLAMIVTALTEIAPITERIVHPLTYLMIPVSGMFFVLDDLPPRWADMMKWVIIPQITDVVRMGMSSSYDSHYVNYVVIIAACAALTAAGLMLLKITRNRMHFD